MASNTLRSTFVEAHSLELERLLLPVVPGAPSAFQWCSRRQSQPDLGRKAAATLLSTLFYSISSVMSLCVAMEIATYQLHTTTARRNQSAHHIPYTCTNTVYETSPAIMLQRRSMRLFEERQKRSEQFEQRDANSCPVSPHQPHVEVR